MPIQNHHFPECWGERSKGVDGEVCQLVDFNRVARQADQSLWKGIFSLNQHAIGIALANDGDSTNRRCSDSITFRTEDTAIDQMPSRHDTKGWILS